MSVKFSQIAGGDSSPYVPATDQILAVRNGTTDVLLEGVAAGPGASTENNIAVFAGTDGLTLADGGTTIAAIDAAIADVASAAPTLSGNNALTGQNTITSIACAGTAPSVTLGTGAGTGASDTLTGHDNAGTLSITTAGTPAATAAIATVAFHDAFANGASVVLFPANAAAAGVVVTAAATNAHFVLESILALTTATTYVWNYQIMGY